VKFVKLYLVALTLAGAACQQSVAPSANKNTPPTTAASPAASAPAAADLSTPSKAALAFYQGVRAKDVKKIEATLSKETLAQAKEQSPEDPGKVIMESVQQSAPPPAALDVRNEKINGDKATLEVAGLDEKNKDKAEIFYFVKEGNDWKVDLFHEDKGDMKKGDMKKDEMKKADAPK
jgi:hypothetical protein